MKAVSAYLKGLQDARGLNDAEVAAKLKPLLGRDVAGTTVWRATEGKVNSRLDVLLGLASVLNANPAEVMYLFTAEVSQVDATEMGARAARGEVGAEVIRDAWRRVPSECRAATRAQIMEVISED